ncbi:mitotic check point protein BUB2 [Diplogelasinospora grovesii]|uniref:Mitotic check point protein BUB2 n=1 Tax=Diplogelasinospora grovesii TaxID=303347 RepID=A0AAN6NE95_9PEZI|nr:mitotic check point protein BUB2 [Diplogelasinospora grovesii]
MTLRDLNQQSGKMPSPTKETIPSLPPLAMMQLHPPPSPGTHRALRRLQSAHSLGAKAANQPSLISQQRLQQQQQQLQQQYLQHQQKQQQVLQQPQLQQPRSPQAKAPSPPRRNANINRSPQRGRANSDAPVVHQLNSAMAAASRRSALSRRSVAADAMSLERLLRDGPPNGDVEGALESTRLKILDQGIKSDSDGMSSLRIYVWLILLNAPVLETDAYLALIHRGASPAYSKIRNDTFRTLTTDPLFRRRVSEASLIRLLNAVAWKLHDAREEQRIKDLASNPPSISSGSRQSLPLLQRPTQEQLQQQQQQPGSRPGSRPGTAHAASLTSSPAAKSRARALTLTTEGSESSVVPEPGTYVQGMNVLAAPFLYAARSEAEAFVAFHQLLTKECPGYIRGAMDGVHKGLALVDKVLAIVDPKLSLYLLSKNMAAEIYAFPSVLTLCACTPPLPEVLRLWDFLFAYGPHLNILCIVAQLVMIRTKIIDSPSPNKLLRSFPALQADQIKRTTLALIKRIPDDVYAEIVAHAH